MLRRPRPRSASLILSIVLSATLTLGVFGDGAVVANGQMITPQVERPILFDSAGRIVTVTPQLAARLSLSAPVWPLGSDWKEARLYSGDGGSQSVLVATRGDGSMARYVLDNDGLARLRRAINDGVRNHAGDVTSVREGTTGVASTGFERSEPAGNSFVRNQVFLGLAAYGPATSAILSKRGGAAATGGYLLAAGSSFFVAAQMIRTRTVTRAQNILATHAGIRGAVAGAALADIFDAHGGAGYGAPILGGALIGTAVGFRAARSMSDGEAAASGLAADMFALTALGVSGAAGAFDSDSGDTGRKTAFSAGIGAGIVGYAIGPHYARRSAYNVTAGDIDVAFSAALIGGLAGAAITDPEKTKGHSFLALGTAGLLGGFIVGDRLLVRKYDRTSADGTWATLGAVAGMLMGGGVGVMTKADVQPVLGLIAAGGALGLFAADRMIAPARDAGPLRGVMRSSLLPAREPVRVRMGLGTVQVTF